MPYERIKAVLPSRVRRHRILAGPLRGKHIYTSWQAYPRAIVGRADPALISWFQQNVHPGETWLDVGAFVGYVSLALGDLVGGGGRVFAFEMLPLVAGYLAQTREANAMNQITVVPLGLGGDPALDRVDVRPTREGMAEFVTETDGQIQSGFVTSLDAIWGALSQGNPRVDGVKVDVQGWEIQTLTGMLGVLREHQPKLVVEVHPGVDRDALLAVLDQAGYGSAFTPIEPAEDGRAMLDDRSYVFTPKKAAR